MYNNCNSYSICGSCGSTRICADSWSPAPAISIDKPPDKMTDVVHNIKRLVVASFSYGINWPRFPITAKSMTGICECCCLSRRLSTVAKRVPRRYIQHPSKLKFRFSPFLFRGLIGSWDAHLCRRQSVRSIVRLSLIPICGAGIVVVQQVCMAVFDRHADRFSKPDRVFDVESVHTIRALPRPAKRVPGIDRQSLPRGIVLRPGAKRRVKIILRAGSAEGGHRIPVNEDHVVALAVPIVGLLGKVEYRQIASHIMASSSGLENDVIACAVAVLDIPTLGPVAPALFNAAEFAALIHFRRSLSARGRLAPPLGMKSAIIVGNLRQDFVIDIIIKIDIISLAMPMTSGTSPAANHACILVGYSLPSTYVHSILMLGFLSMNICASCSRTLISSAFPQNAKVSVTDSSATAGTAIATISNSNTRDRKRFIPQTPPFYIIHPPSDGYSQ